MPAYSKAPLALVGILAGIILIGLITVAIHACRRRKTRRQQYSASGTLSRSRGSGFQRSPTTPSYTMFSEKSPSPSQLSFTLTPNQPVYVDVESEGGAAVGMQLVLTPPTPAKRQRDGREDSDDEDA
ncbi:hypothetical protein FA95DRAFT_1603876 [Auriscalpium vulgare]|uniref:Uncharacterized protein n=1 Tax=Auriscalpium vulgare TaxID=40419 RepID=A0ACB8S0R2_9AGAM|nr:hypothetical protein FA95DRAFT_1603876 [Auriscalpium vulgare]